MPGILAIIVIAIAVAGGLAWRHHAKQREEATDQIERLTNAQAYKMRILRHLLVKKNKSDYKMKIMEVLRIEIELMLVCEEQLKKEKLVTTQPHTMTLTDFGVKFAKIYAEQESENPSP